ncbi:MAG: flippase-like domain-containing protein [Bdellovibrionaceae bacterium]|nr:flippase-like domain-containing protein [Bdellovibrionales bacterium]MCB9253067.1 flippase-like domain-containing protein [Pseudobdellovibrionaceae bacterium]
MLKPSKSQLQKIAAFVVFVGLLYLGWRHSNAVEWSRVVGAPHWALASLICSFLTISLNFQVWLQLLNRNGIPIATKSAYRLYSLASLSRYLPGGQVWQYASLIKFSETPEMKVRTASSQVFATLCGLSGGFLLLFLNLGSVNLARNEQALALASVFLFLLVVAFTHSTSRGKVSLALRFLSRGKIQEIPAISAWNFTAGILASTLSWALTCGSYLCLWHLAGQPVSFDILTYIMASYAIAVLGAYVSIVTPAGLGVREGLFAALLGLKAPMGVAVFVALSGGVSLFLAEVLFLSPFLATHLLRVSRVSSEER